MGPGGIGKTTVAVSVGHILHDDFNGEVNFVDLGSLSNPLLVPSALASVLGLIVPSNDATRALTAFLRDKRVLLVLDSCEHVIETVAVLAESIFQEAPQAHILVTSREALRVEGEYIHQLPPLENLPDGVDLPLQQAVEFSAVRLFVEKVVLGGNRFETLESDAATVSEICRRLDGIPLAIELTAGYVNAFGLQETAALLDSRFRLLWQGRRTAPHRHQTLSATLDWSYDLLSENDRSVLLRLSIFVGVFSFEAARFVAVGAGIDDVQAAASIESLVKKSLLAAEVDKGGTCYRLLDATRAYVSAKLKDGAGFRNVAESHAQYFLGFIGKVDYEVSSVSRAQRYAALGVHLGNVRAALEWSFAEPVVSEISTALAAAAAKLFLELSLLTECRRWTEIAIERNRGATRVISPDLELELQAALGLSLMFTKGNSEEVRAAFARGHELAEQLGDLKNQVRLLGRQHIFLARNGNFRGAREIASRMILIANQWGDPLAIAEAHYAVGVSRHMDGENVAARFDFERALIGATSDLDNKFRFDYDYRTPAKIGLARTFWLLGLQKQAIAYASEAINEAKLSDHPVSQCIALIWAISVFKWNGDYESVELHIEGLLEIADRYSLVPYQAAGRAIRGELLIKRGASHSGIAILREALEDLNASRYKYLDTEFGLSLAEGQFSLGLLEQALDTIDSVIRSTEVNGELVLLPELLRYKAMILSSTHSPDVQACEQYFVRSISLAQEQSALPWELRTSVSFARFLLDQGRAARAQAVLLQVRSRLTQEFISEDVWAADRLLAECAATIVH